MKNLAIALAAAAATLVSGCAHPAYVSPVEITRFTGNAPMALGRGSISVVPAEGTDANSIEYGAYADAVREELAMLGYQVVLENAEQYAVISLDGAISSEERGRSPVGVGVGGSTGTYGSGVGVGVGINLNSLSGPPPETIDRRLFVAIQMRGGDGPHLWEGRAQMSATSNSDFAASPQAAQRMVEALFTNFPGTSGETVSID